MSENKNSIEYKGKVSIKYVRNGRTLKSIQKHNTGCQPLFTFITDCLVSRYQESNRPAYIMLYNNSDPDVSKTDLGQNCLNGVQYVVKTESGYDDVEGFGYAKYKFIVPGNLLSSKANVIALYNLTNAPTFDDRGSMNPSSYIELGEDAIDSSAVTDKNIIIIWELRVSNKGE